MSAENKEVAVQEHEVTGVVVANQSRGIAAKFTAEQLSETDLDNGAMIPETSADVPLPFKLNEESWAPEVGETKDFVVYETGGYRLLPSLEPAKNGALERVKVVGLKSRGVDKTGKVVLERWFVCSKRLVSALENAVYSGYLIPNNARTIARITATGEVKNKRNMFKSKAFDVEIIVK